MSVGKRGGKKDCKNKPESRGISIQGVGLHGHKGRGGGGGDEGGKSLAGRKKRKKRITGMDVMGKKIEIFIRHWGMDPGKLGKGLLGPSQKKTQICRCREGNRGSTHMSQPPEEIRESQSVKESRRNGF